jgi:hypothetical protein
VILHCDHPVLPDLRTVLGQILPDEGEVLFGGQIAIFRISIHELERIETCMHAADQIEIEPPMLLQSVPNAPLAI